MTFSRLEDLAANISVDPADAAAIATLDAAAVAARLQAEHAADMADELHARGLSDLEDARLADDTLTRQAYAADAFRFLRAARSAYCTLAHRGDVQLCDRQLEELAGLFEAK